MPDTSDELDHILDVLCDDPALLSTPEERGIAAVGYHNIEEAKAALIAWKNQELAGERSRHVLREGQLKQELAELKNAINVIISATQEDER